VDSAAPQVEPGARRRRFGIGAILVLVAGLALVGGAIAAIVVAGSYGPLVTCCTNGPVAEETRAVVRQDEDGENLMLIDARRGGTFTFMFEVDNTGRLPLTFEGFRPQEQLERVAWVTDVSVSSQGYEESRGTPEYGTLEGAVVPADATRVLRATVTLRPCLETSSRGTSTSLSAFDLRYGYGPFTRTQTVQMPFELVLLCDPLPAGQ
jgi:hypothetical protein